MENTKQMSAVSLHFVIGLYRFLCILVLSWFELGLNGESENILNGGTFASKINCILENQESCEGMFYLYLSLYILLKENEVYFYDH